jgi:prephenate dehydratase/chorismate mutase
MSETETMSAAEILLTRRQEINAIDHEILVLLNRRAETALWIGEVKSSADTSLCDNVREGEVLERLVGENAGPLEDQGVRNIFQRIIDESLHLQVKTFRQRNQNISRSIGSVKRGRIAILGEPGTFSEEAALALSKADSEIVSRPSFDHLFKAIDDGDAEHILAPLENTLVGPIHRCFDLLLNGDLNIAAEVFLPVSQCLIGCDGATVESLKTVESHPAALGQCEKFFAEHPQLVRLEAADTAGSVKRVVERGDPTWAAIGSRRAADIYGGVTLRENLQDHANNWTRFVLLSKYETDDSRGSKVSLALRLQHKPGSLHGALRSFVRRGINLLKLESRPVKGEPLQFNFYIEIAAPTSEADLTSALSEIEQHAEEVRFVGRYSTLDLTGVNSL